MFVSSLQIFRGVINTTAPSQAPIFWIMFQRESVCFESFNVCVFCRSLQDAGQGQQRLHRLGRQGGKLYFTSLTFQVLHTEFSEVFKLTGLKENICNKKNKTA